MAVAKMAPPAHLATKWHSLDWFKIWSSGGAICIVCKVGHQVAELALPHCLGLSYWHLISVSIGLASSSVRVTSAKFQKGLLRKDRHPYPKIEPPIPGSDKNAQRARNRGREGEMGEIQREREKDPARESQREPKKARDSYRNSLWLVLTLSGSPGPLSLTLSNSL